MTHSNRTYDVWLRHISSDAPAVEIVARKLLSSGVRPWFDKWSQGRGADRETYGRSLSLFRTVAAAIGRSGIRRLCGDGDGKGDCESPGGPPLIAILLPGCPDSPADLPSHFAARVIDMRDGWNNDRTWKELISTITLLGRPTEREIDSSRTLSPLALKRNTISSYDRIAEKFAAQWFDHPPATAIEKLLRPLRANATVLDAGCGPGHHAKMISQCGHDVVGIDLSDGMLQIARQRVHSVRFQKMDIQDLSFPASAFDAVWCAGAAMHVPREELAGLLSGYRQVLRAQGVLAVNLQVGRLSEVVEFDNDNRFFEYYSGAAEIAEYLSQAGFTVEDQDYGETRRNTHGLDLTLRWVTLFARKASEG